LYYVRDAAAIFMTSGQATVANQEALRAGRALFLFAGKPLYFRDSVSQAFSAAFIFKKPDLGGGLPRE